MSFLTWQILATPNQSGSSAELPEVKIVEGGGWFVIPVEDKIHLLRTLQWRKAGIAQTTNGKPFGPEDESSIGCCILIKLHTFW